MNSSSIRRGSQACTIFAISATLTLCGCNLSTSPSDTSSFAPEPATISGVVHGGQQAIYNATINLYAAGTTGYGSASTLLATTTSDVNGNFQFTPGTVSTGITSSWACPTTTPASDPQIYITAIGGNTQGTGIIATNNTASALMAALGPCSGINSSTRVGLNEISTVASVFALAQYINPGTTPGTETVGTNAANTTTPAQPAIGLNNAVTTIATLASISTGGPVTSNSYTGTATSVTGVTVTATPESAKLITIANILAACINTPTAASTQCVDLFNAAVPPSNAAVTSQPSVTFTPAVDTLQAAYYMAVNPIDASTIPYTTCNAGGATRLACLFNLAGSSPPFQTGLSTQPSDWTIGVNFTAAGTCSNNGAFFYGPDKGAIDANGNFWFVNGSTPGPGNIAELSPAGQPLFCSAPSSSFSNGRGLTIDPSGNVFASFDVNTTYTIAEVPAGGTSAVKWTAGVYGSSNVTALNIVSDLSGNIFYTSGQHTTPAIGGMLFEYPAGSSSTTPATLVVNNLGYTGAALATYFVGYTSADPSSHIWMSSQTADDSGTYDMFNVAPTSISITGYSIGSSNSVTFCTATAPAYAIGQNVVVTGLTTGTVLNRNGYTITSTTLSAPCTGFSFTGTEVQTTTLTSSGGALITDSGTATGYSATTLALGTSSSGAAIDANNYVYAATTCCANGADKEIQRVNPSDTAFTTSTPYLGGIDGGRATAIDGAGNQWITNVYPAVGNIAVPGNYAVSETYWTGTAFASLSPAGTTPGTCASSGTTAGCPTGGGFQKSFLQQALDIEVDPSGNLWLPNVGTTNSSGVLLYTGTSVTEIVGAAVPVATPLSVAAKNSKLGQKP